MTEREEQAPPRPRRVPSGIPTLDRLVGGGLLRGDLYVVVGTPGAGKTILANQACFAHVAGFRWGLLRWHVLAERPSDEPVVLA